MVRPTGDYQSLRYNQRHISNKVLTADKKTCFSGISGNAVEMIVKFDATDTNIIEIDVLKSETEVTKIRYYHKRGFNRVYRRKNMNIIDSVLEIDSTHSTTATDILTRPIESMQVEVKDGELTELHIFIDKSIIEVFVNNRDCACVRVYPDNPDSTGISIMSKGRDTVIKSLDIWDMKKIDYRFHKS